MVRLLGNHFSTSWSSLGQGRTQIWKRPIFIGLGVTEYVEIASMMFCECCNYFTRWYPARQGELNIEANTNAALRSSVRHFHFLSVLSVCYHTCLFVCQPVCYAAARPGKAKRYCGEGSSLLIFPNAPTPVLSLGNCINIAVVLHAIVIIVKNTANIKKLALAVTSAIILFKGGCVEKHCYQHKGGGGRQR